MTTIRGPKLLALALLMSVSAYGCARGMLNAESFTDMKKDEYGRSIAADTPRSWQEFRWDIDPQIEEERMGRPAPGFPTWDEKWVRALEWIGKTQENAPKYIGHIIESRRRAGLPELEGFSPSNTD